MPNLSAFAQKQLEAFGVEFRLNAKVEDIDPQGVQLTAEYIPASFVCWSAGVKPCQLEGLETEKSGHVRVGQDCSVPGHPEIFVIGDMARFVPEGSDKPLPGLAPVAIQQGDYVADAIRQRLQGKTPRPFRYIDKGIMATLGTSRAVLQLGKLRFGGLAAWWVWTAVHIYYLIGFRNRILVLFEWLWSYLSQRRGARLISHCPDMPSRPEVRALEGPPPPKGK
jgi:NADH dehydrogenase